MVLNECNVDIFVFFGSEFQQPMACLYDMKCKYMFYVYSEKKSARQMLITEYHKDKEHWSECLEDVICT